MKEIKIIYRPRYWTKTFHESQKRWKVIVAHRRSGKTTACINHLLRDAIKTPNSKYAYIAPTYKQAKNVAWDILKEYARKIDGSKFNESELRVDFANKSRITLYGADNPDSLRGIALWGVIFDEYSQQPSNIFTEIIRPALADHKGYAIWIGTPKGKNDFYRLYEFAKKDEKWLAILLTADNTGLIPKEELEDSKLIMSMDEYQQEWFCSFEAAIKGAVYLEEMRKMRADNRITKIRHENNLQVYTAWDLGMDDSTCIGFFQIIGNEPRMIDYFENRGKSLDFYVKHLHTKEYIYAGHYLPHDIKVKELGTGKSRLEVLQTLGLQNIEVVRNLSLVDGINAAKLLLNKLYIDENLEHFLDCISQYHHDWDDKLGRFKDKPTHDWSSHAADMLRYFAIGYREQIKPKNIYNLQENLWADYSHEISPY